MRGDSPCHVSQTDNEDKFLEETAHKMHNFRNIELVRGRGGYGFTVSGQTPCYIGWIAKSSAAAKTGLRKGDEIISVNGNNVYSETHEKVVQLIGMSAGALNLEVQEGDYEDISSSEGEEMPGPPVSNSRRRLMQGPGSGANSPFDSHHKDGVEFNRTEQVLNELKSGALFQSVITAIDANMYDVESSTASSRSSRGSKDKTKQRSREQRSENLAVRNSSDSIKHKKAGNFPHTSHKRNISAPVDGNFKTSFNTNSSNNVFVQSIVAYLGTVEISVHDSQDVPHASLAAIEACVQQLRREQHIHQRVLLKVTQSSVKLYSADGDVIAVYEGRHICFSSACPDDNRFFCIVTSHGPGQVRCHQFMVDPDICAHRNHLEKARRFGIHCSMDTESGNCIEFPRSPRILLKMVEALFSSQENKMDPSSDGLSAPIMTQPPEMGDMSAASVSTTDSGIDGLNGSAMRVRNHVQQYNASKNKKKKDSIILDNMLSQQNLKRHDMKNGNAGAPDGKINRYMAGGSSQLPPPMPKMGFGKYKSGAGTLPLQNGHSGSKIGLHNSHSHEVRLSKRGRKHNKNGEGLFFRVPKRSSNRHLRLNMKNTMSKSSESIALSEAGALSGASSVESLASNSSLPSCFNGMIAGMNQANRDGFVAGRAANWAVCFDRLLDDGLGVKYFTEFLRKEFSQENILFWLECEKLRKTPPDDLPSLKEISESVYDRFLSSQATSPVNIDGKGQRLSEEARSKPPQPDMFEHQQNQIYKLMKLDSYSRFLKSTLYRQCILCEMEGRSLPLDPEQTRELPEGVQLESRQSFSLKHRRFFHRNSSKSQKSQGSNDSIHRQDSSDSETGFLEAITKSLQDDQNPLGLDASKICRLTLWDRSSTVIYAAAGHTTIRDALGALCERRGVPLSAVDVYYHNEDKALALDQDVSVLAGQEVRVERRTLFRLDMLPIGRSVGVKAKPSKPIHEVLKPVVAKYGLQLEDLQTRLNGEKTPVDMTQPVQILDSLRVCVDQSKPQGSESKDKTLKKSKNKTDLKRKESVNSRQPGNSDTDDLINVVTAARSSKLHDQCGLLSEMNIELPEFLRMKPPAAEQPIPASGNDHNSNNSNNGSLESILSADRLSIDVPASKGSRLSPNPVTTGNAKARIQKLKHVEELRPQHLTPKLARNQRKKLLSADADISFNGMADAETDGLPTAVDDDPFVINKWMQSASCTPKYQYAPDLETTMSTMPSPALLNGDGDPPSLYIPSSPSHDTASSDSQSSSSHDHKYTKRKGKSIMV